MTLLTRNELLNIYRSFDNPKQDRDSVLEVMQAAVEAYKAKLAKQEPEVSKTPAQHQKEFEEWANEYFGVESEGYGLNYSNELVKMAWIAWKAARGN